MTDRQRFRPFTGDAEAKIRLAQPPIALVVCQLRWPELSQLQGDLAAVAQNFGKSLDGYPLTSSASGTSYTISPDGVTQLPAETVYSWRTIDDSWHVNLSRRTVTLYGTAYTEFADFRERLSRLLGPLEQNLHVPLIERIGVRYVNRVDDPTFVDNVSDFVQPEVMGLCSLNNSTEQAVLQSSINQATYLIGGDVLHARTGILPPGQTFDPAIPPVATNSWVLDLDASAERILTFDATAILEEQGRLADIAYDFFKHVSTDGFIKKFGGDL